MDPTVVIVIIAIVVVLLLVGMGFFCLCPNSNKTKSDHGRLEETPRETPHNGAFGRPNLNNESAYNNLNDSGGFQNNSGGFQNNSGGFQNNSGGFQNNHNGGYNSGVYQNNRNPYDQIIERDPLPNNYNNSSNYNNRRDPFAGNTFGNASSNNNPIVGGSRSLPGATRATRAPEPAKTKNDHFFPELLELRLDETEVLLTRKISTGAFGVVWLGHYHGQPVAVKRMIDGGQEDAVSFSREIQTIYRLTHPKIVRFIGCTWSQVSDLSAVTEFMDGGDVRSLLENRKVDLSWKREKISIAIDVSEALAYMHSLSPKIIHRDLKSRNVLLNAQLVAKLSDFGLSRNRTYEETLTAGVGTVRWTAPEVMLGENYSEQADVYSFGVVLSELDTREIPFEEKGTSRSGAPGAPDMAIVIKVAKGELRPSFSADCPEPINKIAKACLQFDPALRPSASSVVRMLNDAKAQLLAM